ncbi:epimerase [Pseudooceanicola marinus]|uniref:epimerase n=1 Tax=Pseudooceanicola marinus TaxID=396013 RepID=UPI001CD73545|nr:epimerase [Pseudooceanicola marinus]MCA1337653.1 epimerase [Pseudooceanicola marinus]
MPGKVLILGSHGRFGHHAAQAFGAAGWQVTIFDRHRDDLASAVQGQDVIVMAANPGGYQHWARELLPLHRALIAAAQGSGATILLPGNVYVFGPEAPFGWDADTPHLATNPLGRLRQQMEGDYRASGLQVIVLRCGDFLDTRPSGNWFDAHIAKGAHRGRFAYPGPLDRPHAWAYLPDATRAAVALAEQRTQLGQWEDVPFPGYTLTGTELAAATGRAIGRDVPAGRMAWWPLAPLRPVVPALRGIFEMRYLWSLPHRLEGAKLQRLRPGFADTPVEEAIAAGLAHHG